MSAALPAWNGTRVLAGVDRVGLNMRGARRLTRRWTPKGRMVTCFHNKGMAATDSAFDKTSVVQKEKRAVSRCSSLPKK